MGLAWSYWLGSEAITIYHNDDELMQQVKVLNPQEFGIEDGTMRANVIETAERRLVLHAVKAFAQGI